MEQFGEHYPGDAGRRAFPTARAIAAGELDLAALASPALSTTELRRQLLAIKGVGSYAAATLLMLLGRYDKLPMDSVFREFVSRTCFGGAAVDDVTAASYAEWGERALSRLLA